MLANSLMDTRPAFLRRAPLSVLVGCSFTTLGGRAQAQTNNTPPAGYVLCAAESQRCNFNGTASVVYGARTTWTAPRSFTSGVACNNANFGDPLREVAKACYVRAAPAPSTPSAATTA